MGQAEPSQAPVGQAKLGEPAPHRSVPGRAKLGCVVAGLVHEFCFHRARPAKVAFGSRGVAKSEPRRGPGRGNELHPSKQGEDDLGLRQPWPEALKPRPARPRRAMPGQPGLGQTKTGRRSSPSEWAGPGWAERGCARGGKRDFVSTGTAPGKSQ